MFGSKKRLFVYITLLLSIIFSQANVLVAQETPVVKLLTVVPDDIVGFYATSGGDSLKPAFDKSILGRIWNDPNVQSFYQSIHKQLMSKIKLEAGEPNNPKNVEMVFDLVKLALSRPIIAGASLKQAQTMPPILGFVILDAGARKDEIAAKLTKLESLAGEDNIMGVTVGSAKMHGPKNNGHVPIYWGWVDNYLILAINDSDGLAIKYLSAPPETPPDYFNNVKGNGDALAVYYNFQRLAGFVNIMAQQDKAGEKINLIKSAVNELGLSNVKTMTVRVGFEGADLVSNSLFEVPGPRTGLLADFKAADLSMFDMVDARAMNASIANMDFAGMYDTIIDAVKIAAPNDVYAEVMKGISDFEQQTKIQIRTGFLESLAGPVVSYQIPMGVMMDMPNGGVVLVAKLKDAALWEKSMTALEQFVMAQEKGMIQVGTEQQDGRTVHTWAIMPLAVMQIMPCWTVVDDNLVISTNLNLSKIAVEQVNSGKDSIRTTEEFKQVMTNLPDNVLSVEYVNGKLQFKQMMTGLQQVWPMATMFAAKAGLTLPFVLPDLSKIADEVTPSCQYCWYDGTGFRSRYRGDGIQPSLAAVAGSAFAVGVAMPALARSRKLAFRTKSAANLKQIGMSMMVYANEHDDQFPPDLQELARTTDLSDKELESPRKPKGFNGPSYIYVAGQNISMNPGNILVYENPEFSSEGLNVLFLDGHIQWDKRNEFLNELKATYERLGKETPQIKFKD
jgi:prepilin-type processing-associated H-X9-DG protein